MDLYSVKIMVCAEGPVEKKGSLSFEVEYQLWDLIMK